MHRTKFKPYLFYLFFINTLNFDIRQNTDDKIRGLMYKTLILKVYVRTKANFCACEKSFKFIKASVHHVQHVQNSLYKSQSGEDCAHVLLHPDFSPKSPYMELTTPSFTMHNLICISFHAYSHPRSGGVSHNQCMAGRIDTFKKKNKKIKNTASSALLQILLISVHLTLYGIQVQIELARFLTSEWRRWSVLSVIRTAVIWGSKCIALYAFINFYRLYNVSCS